MSTGWNRLKLRREPRHAGRALAESRTGPAQAGHVVTLCSRGTVLSALHSPLFTHSVDCCRARS